VWEGAAECGRRLIKPCSTTFLCLMLLAGGAFGGATEGGVGGHDQGFGAETGDFAPGTRRTADHEGGTPSVIAYPVHPQSSESMLPDRGARRPEFRHHDPQYRVSMLAATTTCTRYRQVTAAITG
jgi:hypothetical protein